MARKKGEPPAYRKHKASGQAYVSIGGKDCYLGAHGSRESRRRYKEIVRRWEQEDDVERKRYGASPGCTLADLVAAHDEHAREYYRTPEGEATSEQAGFVMALKPLLGDGYADMAANEFSPADLEDVREGWIKAGHARTTVNQYTRRIRRMFRWAAGKQLVSSETAGALFMVADLAEGRTVAPDYDDVEPAPDQDIEAVLQSGVNEAVKAMIRLQLYCGARPGEVCRMRIDEIDREGFVHTKRRKIPLPGGVWVFQPGRYKQRHRGLTIAYILGDRAKAVLAPLLARTLTDWIFPSPHKSGSPWRREAYWRAVERTCERLGIPHWSVGQLRHNFLQKIDRVAGIQAASVMVGHTSIATTEIYLEKNFHQAAELAAKYG